ncbi:hypothetical protein ACUHMQ_19170 [Chitinimonas sp. PSY-7]|uniref:hypothetical protein n=1 Tax=Chitinimonas sp. PSY-7 TaxID=3459088 RepID=UPI00404027C2
MKPAWKFGIAICGLVSLLALGYVLRPVEPVPTMQYVCNDLTKPCAIQINGQPFVLHAERTPSALKPFRLVLRGPGNPDVNVRFGMRGMEMGPIAFPLHKLADNSMSADIVLPYCVQRRHDWWLQLEAGDEHVEIAFSAAT